MTDAALDKQDATRSWEIPVRLQNDMYWFKIIGGAFFALVVGVSGILYTEIGSLRDEIGALKDDMSDVRAALARIEVVLGNRQQQ